MESVREARVFRRSRCCSGSAQTRISSNVDPCADSLILCAGNLAEGSHLRAIGGDVFADKRCQSRPVSQGTPPVVLKRHVEVLGQSGLPSTRAPRLRP
jgi:hypothetical protein